MVVRHHTNYTVLEWGETLSVLGLVSFSTLFFLTNSKVKFLVSDWTLVYCTKDFNSSITLYLEIMTGALC